MKTWKQSVRLLPVRSVQGNKPPVSFLLYLACYGIAAHPGWPLLNCATCTYYSIGLFFTCSYNKRINDIRECKEAAVSHA